MLHPRQACPARPKPWEDHHALEETLHLELGELEFILAAFSTSELLKGEKHTFV